MCKRAADRSILGMNRTLTTALITTAAALAAVPATANAADVFMGGPTLNYDAKPGERNAPRLTAVDKGHVVISDTAPLRAANRDCTQITPNQVACFRSDQFGIANASIKLGDGNDVFFIQAGQFGDVFLEGGAGDDVYSATVADEPHSVRFAGGPGNDTATYTSSPAGVRVFKDGQRNDGRINVDSDSIEADVERLDGTFFNDTLVGVDDPTLSMGLEVFDGKFGNDVMNGQRGFAEYEQGITPDGADVIVDGGFAGKVDYSGRRNAVTITVSSPGARDDGEAGEQDQIVGPRVLVGGAGNDRIQGGTASIEQHAVIEGNAGNDVIGGTSGQDTITGGPGADIIAAGAGTDSVNANDGTADNVDCGSGGDGATTDRIDSTVNCESNRNVGKLALAADGNALELAWTHPRDWKRLESVTLQVRNAERLALGTVTVNPRTGKVTADGRGLGLDAKRVKVTTNGKRVSARIVLKPTAALVGQRLTADVVAVDTRGARQTEQRAAVIRVR